jgi:hypothetical protein
MTCIDADRLQPFLGEMLANGIDTRLVRRSSQFLNSYAYNFLSEANPNEKT